MITGFGGAFFCSLSLSFKFPFLRAMLHERYDNNRLTHIIEHTYVRTVCEERKVVHPSSAAVLSVPSLGWGTLGLITFVAPDSRIPSRSRKGDHTRIKRLRVEEIGRREKRVAE